ncbi:hypothetical protein IFM89_028745 [Coptis chinensis]|uniref:E3 ubiquitin-protein ligase LIN n=1 Tax=Coptis chinensis TaxID=261450 RepID=A0A835LCU9_9MAGN|nr:hypothetical protein IFM89_028745 [Coptis chinensis]
MASLQQLLSEEGFERRKKTHPVWKTRITPDKSVALPIYICHDRRSFDFSKQKSVSRQGSSTSIFSSVKGTSLRAEKILVSRNELEIDEVAVKAVISILSGYIGRFMKDDGFRENIREKCYECLSTKVVATTSKGDDVIGKIVLGMEYVERLAENLVTQNDLKLKILSNSIKLLDIVGSLNSPNSKSGTTCGVPNSNLSACAELYLSILTKFEKKDRVCARHLLQVFCVSPFIARTHLLPEIWERFFLPHLLHIKVWYVQEVEITSNSRYVDNERRLNVISKAYNDQMDLGTRQFALYYKEWLKIGVVKAPPVPSVSLPSVSSKGFSLRRSSGSFRMQSPINKNLQSIESSSQSYKNPKAELWPETKTSDYWRKLSCQSKPSNALVCNSHVDKNNVIVREPIIHYNLPSSNLSSAITTICSSDILTDCEISIRVVAKAWLDSHGGPSVAALLCKAPVIEGMLEVLFVSKDDEVLELAVSILAELVSRSKVNRQIILNSDPQLEIFMGLLRNSGLFLKSSVLLYLLKPEAKQMLSMDWVPLVLRLLHFGDQLQTLFTIRCSPQVAAFYLLEQLLTGFEVEINIENARKVVSLGGLSILVQKLETGGRDERSSAALFISSCIQADGSCRHYIANNVKKSSILELLVLENQTKSSTFAISLLIDLLCLNRKQVTKFLNGLQTDGGYLNTMHILMVCLQHAPLEERPLVAAILLQLDLLGDHLQSSVYREEVLDAMVEALDCKNCNKTVQEQSGRALLLLGGRFSYVGKASVETWLLKQAGYEENLVDSFNDDMDIVIDEITGLNEEEEATEDWIRKAATVLLMNGNKRLLTALSGSIENGIPCLARASLITVAWMSSSLHFIQDASLRSLACSILAPQLLETLNYDRQLEERVLASLSLLSLLKNSGSQSMLAQLDKNFVSLLRNLSLVTWTAEELLSVAMNGSNHWYAEEEIVPNKKETFK